MDTRSPWGLILLLWAAGLGAAGQFAKFATVFAELTGQYPGAGTTLGFLVSLISALGIAFGLVAGLGVARFGARRLLLGALALGAALSFVQAAMLPLPVMLASRVLEGLSHLVIVVAAPTLIARLAAPADRGLAMSLWSTFFGVTFALTAGLGPPLVARAGLGALVLVHALWMTGVLLALWRALPADPTVRGPTQPAPLDAAGMLARHVEIYASPRMAAPALGWLFYTLTWVSVLTVVPTALEPAARMQAATLMPLAGIAVSMTIGVWLLRRVAPVELVIAGFALAATMALALAVWPASPLVPVAMIAALGLVQGASFAAVPALNADPADQAAANGAMAQMGNLGNTLGTPVLLVLTGAFDRAGLIGFLLICYGAAIALHLWLASRRRDNPA